MLPETKSRILFFIRPKYDKNILFTFTLCGSINPFSKKISPSLDVNNLTIF